MNNHLPLISVVTVCFNSRDYIRQCLESVVSQDFDDYEYIVIDGGSQDGTTGIIEQYEEHLAYYRSKPDHGISDAFNQALKHAKGKWIAFLNSDDCYCDNQVLSSIAEILRGSECMDLVYGQIQIIERQQAIVPISPRVGEPWVWEKFRFRSTIPHPASFTHRRFFEKFGGFDEGFRNALDYEFYLRAKSSLKVQFFPHLLVWMRDGGMSTDEAYRSYRESKDAQIKHGVFGQTVAWMVYMSYIIRVFVRQRICRL